MRISALIMSIAILPACVQMPKQVRVSESSYDGTKEIYIEPGFAHKTIDDAQSNKQEKLYGMKVGVRKTSKMPEGEAILIVAVPYIRYFSPTHPNFHVKIDGEEIHLSPTSKNTECDVMYGGASNCVQEYIVKISFIEKMLQAKDVRFKLDLRDNSYETGGLAQDGEWTARDGLRQFLKLKSL